MARSVLPSDANIGDRLRRLRTERGLTQEGLASAAAVSVDMIKKLEQGRRDTARLTSLMALADALDVSMSELTDKRPRLDGGTDRLVLGLRDAILDPALLPGIDVREDNGEATSTAALQAAVERAWDDYWAGRFVELARRLPALLAEARITARTDGATAAAQALAQTHQLAACLFVHLGRDDLAAIAAERALTAAAAGRDELQAAALLGTYAWTMLHQGRPAEAARFAVTQAEQIEPRFSSARPEEITVWGGLTITAMAAAAAAGDADMVNDLSRLGRAGAAMARTDRRAYQVVFGPGQMAVQVTHAHTVLGQPGHALKAATGVVKETLRPVEYGRHLIDIAHAHAGARRADRAIGVLRQAQSLGPVWFRHQGPARSLVADLAERQTRISPALRDLVRVLDAH